MSKTFKVVKIINEYKVVVNAGSQDFIREGAELEIFAPGKDVIDPDTGENLGALDYVKAKLCVIDVFPKMSICENYDGERIRTIEDVLSHTITEKIPLNVDAKDISGGFEGISKKIRVGDLVRTRD